MSAEKQPKLVMCAHCKYAYPAGLERCNLCGYPWPWLATKPKKHKPSC